MFSAKTIEILLSAAVVSFFLISSKLISYKRFLFRSRPFVYVKMHFQSTIFAFLLVLGAVKAQSGACSQLAGYQPAVTYCATRYPAPIPTITRTTTKTVTVRASTTSVATKPSTSLVAGNGRTRTITAVEEVTVTNCNKFTRPACPPSTATPISAGSFTAPSSARVQTSTRRSYSGNVVREAEADPQRSGLSGSQAIVWARVLSSGNSSIQSVCSCLRPAPSRTVTISATTTVTATTRW